MVSGMLSFLPLRVTLACHFRPAGYEAPSMSSATPLPAEHSSLDPSHTYKPEELTSAGKPITTSPSQSGGEQRNVTDYPSATAAPDNSQRQQGRQAVGLVYGSKLNESDSLTEWADYYYYMSDFCVALCLQCTLVAVYFTSYLVLLSHIV